MSRSRRLGRQQTADLAFCVALAGTSFVLYVLTLAPTVLEGDSGEFQVLLRTLGIVHTTGYPLYTLIGHAFTWLPFGDVAYRVNLFSAAATALSVPVVYLVARRLTASVPTPFDRILAALTAIVYAVGYSVWSQAVVASVYGLNVLFAAVVVYLALRWSEADDQRADRWFLALALVYGLSLAHHRTMLLWAPGLAVFVLWTRPTLARRGRLLAQATALCLLPLLLYLYIPLRAWQLNYQRVLGGLLPWITGSDFGGHLGQGLLQMDVSTQLDRYVELLVRQVTWIGVGLGLVGLVWLCARRDRARFTALTGLSLLALSVFALAYRYGDPAQATYNLHVYLLPAYLVWALWMGAGAAGLAAYVKGPVVCALLALLSAFLLLTTYLPLDMSGNDTVARYARQVLAQPFEADAVVFGEWDHITPLWYLQQVEGLRPDLTIVDAPVLDRHWTAYIAQQAQAGRPIYLYRGPTRMDARYDVEPFGPASHSYVARTDRPFRDVTVPGLVHLARVPDIAPSHPATHDFAGQVTLVGLDAAMDTPADAPLPVALYWRAGPNLDADYRVSLRLLDFAGRVVAQMDKPADDFYDYGYPMTHWPADTTIRDKYQLDLATGTPPGTYTLEVRVYGDAGDLAVDGGPEPAARIGPVTVAPPTYALALVDVQPMHPVNQAVNPALYVAGYDVEPPEPTPGQSTIVTVYWQAQRYTTTDALVSLQLASVSGDVVTTTVPAHPCSGAYPTSGWRPGEVVRDVYRLTLPRDLPNRNYEVAVLVFYQGNVQRLVLGSLPSQVRARRFNAPPIGNPLSLHLGDGVELLGYEILPLFDPTGAYPTLTHRRSVTAPYITIRPFEVKARPGAQYQLTLYWRCRAPMDVSYTVFVHLLDPADTIRYQRDNIPCAGACSTTSWVPGEVLVDRYDIILPTDAPPGKYRLAVGMYDASTGQRLPVTDARGASLGDRVLLGPIEVMP